MNSWGLHEILKHVLTRKEMSQMLIAHEASSGEHLWLCFLHTYPVFTSHLRHVYALTERVSKSGWFLFQGRSMCPAPGPAPHPKKGSVVSNTPPHIRHRESTDTGVVRRYRREWLRGKTFSSSSRAALRPCKKNVFTSRRRRSRNGSIHFFWR